MHSTVHQLQHLLLQGFGKTGMWEGNLEQSWLELKELNGGMVLLGAAPADHRQEEDYRNYSDSIMPLTN